MIEDGFKYFGKQTISKPRGYLSFHLGMGMDI